MERSLEVAVVGATGVVGRDLLLALHALGHPPEHVTALASERSEGTEVDFGLETLEVERATPEALRGRKLVLLATPPDVARQFALAAQAAGAWAVDLSRAFVKDAAVPTVLPAVNLARLREPISGRIVRCPSPVSTALLTVLEPLRKAFGVQRVHATALVGASAQGVRGVKALEAQTAGLLSGRELEEGPFPHRLAFNVIPQVGAFDGLDLSESGEERAWREDAAAVWGDVKGAEVIGGLALQAPYFFGHVVSFLFELGRDASADAVRAAWRESAALKVLDEPAAKVYPMPMLAMGDPAVLVGRLCAQRGSSRLFSAFAVVDNAGRGAAQNAVEVADALLQRS